jgi:hypothetical protein
MIIQEEQGEELLGQIFLRSYTSFGVNVQICGSSLEDKISFSLDMARSYVQDPESFDFSKEKDINISPPLEYFPLLRSSQLIETSSIGAYRYELHTRCSSVHRIQYHHILFCYAPFQEKPCFVVSAESFGDFGPTLGVFHNKGHSNLGAKPNLLDIEYFREAAFSLVRKELLKETLVEQKDVLPDYMKGELIEKGLIGHFRCALYVDIPPKKKHLFFHVFALFMGEMKKPEFLFVLEKQKQDPTPKLVLYRHDVRSELGFEQSLLDVKMFRDRVVVLLKLILREEELKKLEITSLSAEVLLRIQVFFELILGSILVSLGILCVRSFGFSISNEMTHLLVTGSHGVTLMCAAITLRYAGIKSIQSLFFVFVLALPLYEPILLPFSFFALFLLQKLIARLFRYRDLEYNWMGLSYSARKKLKDIVFSAPIS